MRLSVETIKAAILDPDPRVREESVYFFAGSYSADPTIMPLAIRAIESFGLNAFVPYQFMLDLVQTDNTLTWLIQEIERDRPLTSDPDAKFTMAACTALRLADTELLERHQTRIREMKRLDGPSQELIARRIAMRSIAPNALWRRLSDFCDELDAQAELTDQVFTYACCLVDALARHSEALDARVLSILAGATQGSSEWLEIMTTRLAGELKLEAAIPTLIDRLEWSGTWLGEAAHRALEKIGTDAVVEQLANGYPAGDWDYRLGVATLLDSLHSELSVRTALALLDKEEDEELRGMLLEAVLLNFATEGIEPARQYVLTSLKTPGVLEVRSALLVVSRLSGGTFPEYEAWLSDSVNDVEFRKQWYKGHSLDFGDEDLDDGTDLDPFEDEDEPSVTIVRRAERIGRNDPCPCGSGKKYKKCCYGKECIVEESDVNHSASMSAARPSRAAAKFPVGTVAFYGPDGVTTTKIVAGVIKSEGAEPILERWAGSKIMENPKAKRQMEAFFGRYKVKSVVASEGNIGCPHEEGLDFPLGEDCPFCPYWAGKQGSGLKE